MWYIVILVVLLAFCLVICLYDDPNCNHEHDFDGPDAMPLIVDGVLVGWCCANPRCTVIRLEENIRDGEEESQ